MACVARAESTTFGGSGGMLLDTGCSQTLVHRCLVPNRKIDNERRLRSRCVHGDVLDYPTAIIRVSVNAVTNYVRAGVSSTLPRPILLGHNFGDLRLFMSSSHYRRKEVQRENVKRLHV